MAYDGSAGLEELTTLPGFTLTLDEGTVSSRHMTVDGAFTFHEGRLEVRNFTGDLVNDTAGTFAPDRGTEPTRIDGTYTQANDATIESTDAARQTSASSRWSPCSRFSGSRNLAVT